MDDAWGMVMAPFMDASVQKTIFLNWFVVFVVMMLLANAKHWRFSWTQINSAAYVHCLVLMLILIFWQSSYAWIEWFQRTPLGRVLLVYYKGSFSALFAEVE